MENRDYLRLSAEEFGRLEHYELQEALQLIAGAMAVCQADMREDSAAHHRYLAAKEQFTFLKSTATTLQTLLRAGG